MISMESIKELDVAVNAIANTAPQTVTKDQITSIIDNAKISCSSVHDFFHKFTDKQLAELAAKWTVKCQSVGRMTPQELKKNPTAAAVWVHCLAPQFNTAARRDNASKFIYSIEMSIRFYLNVLDEITESIDDIIKNSSMTIYNTKISHAVVIGMVDKISKFALFCETFIGLATSELLDGSVAAPPPATAAILANHYNDAAQLINLCYTTKADDFINHIQKFASSGDDIIVANPKTKSALKFFRSGSGGIKDDDFTMATHGVGIFKRIGEFFSDRIDNKIRRLRAEREILDNRAKLLQLSLVGKSEDDPEYIRIAKIVEKYQKLINDIDRKLERYE